MLLSKIGGALAHALGRMTATSESKILAVISSASAPDLKDGKTYSTGYYLNEPVIPYRKLLEAGYDPVIANPKDNRPRTLITGLHEPRCPRKASGLVRKSLSTFTGQVQFVVLEEKVE